MFSHVSFNTLPLLNNIKDFFYFLIFSTAASEHPYFLLKQTKHHVISAERETVLPLVVIVIFTILDLFQGLQYFIH